MAINPAEVVTPNKRFFENEAPPLHQLGDPKTYLIQSASRLVKECPPTLPWASSFRGQVYKGLFLGPTSIAYFFLTLSTKHPELEIRASYPQNGAKRISNLDKTRYLLLVQH